MSGSSRARRVPSDDDDFLLEDRPSRRSAFRGGGESAAPAPPIIHEVAPVARSAADPKLVPNVLYAAPGQPARLGQIGGRILDDESLKLFDFELAHYRATAVRDAEFETELSIKYEFESAVRDHRPLPWNQLSYDEAVESCWRFFVEEAKSTGRSVLSWGDFLFVSQLGAPAVAGPTPAANPDDFAPVDELFRRALDPVVASPVRALEAPPSPDGGLPVRASVEVEGEVGGGVGDPDETGPYSPRSGSLGGSSPDVDSPRPSPKYDIRAYTRAERLRLGLPTPLSEEWCVACLRRLFEHPFHKCHTADDMDRCDWCTKQHGHCNAVSPFLSSC